MDTVEKASSMPMAPSEDPLFQHLIRKESIAQARVGGTNGKAQINRKVLRLMMRNSNWFRSTAIRHTPILRAAPRELSFALNTVEAELAA